MIGRVCQTAASKNHLHGKCRHFVIFQQQDMQTIVQRGFLSLGQSHTENISVDGRLPFEHRASDGLIGTGCLLGAASDLTLSDLSRPQEHHASGRSEEPDP